MSLFFKDWEFFSFFILQGLSTNSCLFQGLERNIVSILRLWLKFNIMSKPSWFMHWLLLIYTLIKPIKVWKEKKNKGWAQRMPQKLLWLNMKYIHLDGLMYNAWCHCRSMEALTVFNSLKKFMVIIFLMTETKEKTAVPASRSQYWKFLIFFKAFIF